MNAQVIKLETIEKDTLWVVKMTGWRKVGTMEEVKHLAEMEECRDMDICATQPEHLKPFFDKYFSYEKEHGFIAIPDYYKTIYLVEMQATPAQKVWTEDEIKNLIQTNDRVLYNALKKLYALQTADEQNSKETRNLNGVGFNSYDAPFLSDVTQFLLKAGFLTEPQKRVVRRKLIKYAKQLTKIANGKI